MYRLTGATGIFRGNDEAAGYEQSKEAKYTLVMDYDTIHNIKLKDQKVFKDIGPGVEWKEEKKGTYNFSYDYNAKDANPPPNSLETIRLPPFGKGG